MEHLSVIRLGMLMVMPGMFQLPDQHGHANSRQEGERQPDAVVSVEMQLGQQIRTGNPQKCSGTEGQRAG